MGGSSLDLHASATYTWYHGQCYDLQFGALPHRERHKPTFATSTDSVYPMSDIFKTAGLRRFDLYVDARHRVYPRQAFYGLGPDTTEDQRTEYELDDTLIEVVSEYRIRSWLTVAIRGGVLWTSLGPGAQPGVPNTQDVFDEETAPGLEAQPNYVHASAGLLVDTRDVPGNPHGGGALGAAITRSDDLTSHDFQFNRFTMEGRRYWSFGGRRRHVLALHGLASFDQADSGSSIPFYLQSALGGGHVLRAYHTFRFRDEDLLALSAEYRFDLRPRVELAAFYDSGKVFPGIGDLSFKDLARTWGVGVRLKTPTKVRLRVDLGFGPEGTRLLVKFGPAF
jgi:outer membrane protein assembly factor BamA